jgi:hypothetical protein
MRILKYLGMTVFLLGALAGNTLAQEKVGVLPFEEKNAPGLGYRVREALVKSFRAAGMSVVDVDNAAKGIPGAPQLGPDGARKLGQQTGVKWVVTGRVVGGPATFVVAKVLSTTSDEVTGDARQVRDPAEMEAALKDLAEKLINKMR